MALRFVEQLRGLGGHVCALASNRLALFGLEWREETGRLLGYLAVLLAVVGLAAFFLLFATLAVLVLAWQSGYLLAATILVAIGYGALALIGALWLRASLHAAPPPFAATRAEFERDRLALGPHGGQAS